MKYITFILLLLSGSVFATSISQTQFRAPNEITHKKVRQHHDVWISAVETSLKTDADYDGFYQSLLIDLDLDTHQVQQDVVVTFSLQSQTHERYELYQIPVHQLYGQAYHDVLSLEFLFLEPLSSDLYTLLIEVRESSTYQPLLSTEFDYYAPLHQLPLESNQRDSQMTQLNINDAHVSLMRDNDHDTFYESFNLSLAIETSAYHQPVYVALYLSGEKIYQSSVFNLDGPHITNYHDFDVALIKGVSPHHYQLEVKVIDPNSSYVFYNNPLTQFANLKLESQEYSHHVHPTTNTQVEVTHQSGALSMWMLLLSSGLIYLRRGM